MSSPTTARRRTQRASATPIEDKVDAALLDTVRDPIRQLATVIRRGPDWFGESVFDAEVGPVLMRELVAMLYAHGYGQELVAAVIPYLVAQASSEGPDRLQLEYAQQQLRAAVTAEPLVLLERAREEQRREVAA
jgi:hypothetical protein